MVLSYYVCDHASQPDIVLHIKKLRPCSAAGHLAWATLLIEPTQWSVCRCLVTGWWADEPARSVRLFASIYQLWLQPSSRLLRRLTVEMLLAEDSSDDCTIRPRKTDGWHDVYVGAIPCLRCIVMNPAVGWHYFRSGPQLPPQPLGVTVLSPVPTYTAWWQRHTGVRNLPRVFTP